MHSFKRWVKNILFLLVAVFSAGTFFVIAEGVRSGTELSPVNSFVEDFVFHLRTPTLTHVMLFITNLGSPAVLCILAVFIAIILLLKQDTYDALLYIVSLVVSVVAFVLFKNGFRVTRPVDALVELSSWSFPSGHATVSAAFFFTTAYTFFGRLSTVWGRIALVLGCALAAALISATRLYLGAHWALDVMAGAALGLLCVSLTALFFNIFLYEEKWRHRLRRVIR